MKSDYDDLSNPVLTSFTNHENQAQNSQNQFAILDALMVDIRKSLIICSMEREDVPCMDIGWTIKVLHVLHVKRWATEWWLCQEEVEKHCNWRFRL